MSTLVRNISALVVVTPVISSGAIYATGDQLGGLQTLTGAMFDTKYSAALVSVVVVDADKQKSALDIFFFDSVPTLSVADNAAFALTQVELEKCIGVVNVAATDYSDTAARSVATVKGIGLLLRAATAGSKDIYAIAVVRGTPTYTGTSKLVFKYGVFQD